MERALAANPAIARSLVRLFEARFDPAAQRQRGNDRRAVSIVSQIRTLLDAVTSLDDDRILRAYLTLIQATLRTNFYQLGADAQSKPYLSFKFDPGNIPDLPLPRPKFEIFVYSPQVEGVHLRMGDVARGGLRWSDRREDFRTEVLGLMKAQNVKNTLIVPVGAKGGFVAKRLPAERHARGSAGRGHRLLPDLHPRAARSDRQHRLRAHRAAAAGGAQRRRRSRTSWSRPTRVRRRFPTSPMPSPPNTTSGSAMPLPRAARPVMTTRRWASPRAAPGSASSATSARWLSIRNACTLPWPASATCPVTCSATACCCRGISSCRLPSIIAISSSTPSRTRSSASPSGRACSRCRARAGMTTTARSSRAAAASSRAPSSRLPCPRKRAPCSASRARPPRRTR